MRIKLILTQLLLWALAVGAAVLTGVPDFYALLLLPVIGVIAIGRTCGVLQRRKRTAVIHNCRYEFHKCKRFTKTRAGGALSGKPTKRNVR